MIDTLLSITLIRRTVYIIGKNKYEMKTVLPQFNGPSPLPFRGSQINWINFWGQTFLQVPDQSSRDTESAVNTCRL
jgi:hypothetical protein